MLGILFLTVNDVFMVATATIFRVKRENTF